MEKLKKDQLTIQCDVEEIEKMITKDPETLDIIIGQERASKALKVGIGIPNAGFNIFIAGVQGTGKLSTVKKYLEQNSKQNVAPPDWCYVNNFKDAYRPMKLEFPSGAALEFKKDMERLVLEVKNSLVKVFEGEEYLHKRNEIVDKLERKKDKIFKVADERFKKENWQIQKTPYGFVTVPLKEGLPLTEEEYHNLSDNEKEGIRKVQRKFQEELKSSLREIREINKEINERLARLDKEVATYTIEGAFDELSKKYTELENVLTYLEEAKEDIVNNLGVFLTLPHPNNNKQNPLNLPAENYDDFLNRYSVNLLVSNSDNKGIPVIVELNPNFSNLFGKVEKESHMGALVTDFTLIRKGALHSANGGYLLLPVEELFKNPYAWDGLKRAMRNSEILIEDPLEQMGLFTTKTLKPEPIPLNAKIILLGLPIYYHLLYEHDSDFRKLFKVKVDFDHEMKRDKQNIYKYVLLLGNVCKKEKLLEMDNTAISKIVEHGSRLSANQDKLATRFGEIVDVIREANYYAVSEGQKKINEKHILIAIEERFYRSNLVQEKLQELIQNNVIRISTEGEVVGQINGLSVADLGDIHFGMPIRITASISLGRKGVLTIEREAKLSGPMHTKGVLILSGYLSEKFFQDIPVSLTARIVFEQSYSEVDGDSASSTELYALLSSLSGLPLKQGIAVTGSVNQKGEIQAIGGVNEKIEGYFESCKLLGLNGEQGVMIPKANQKNLVLKHEVILAVEKGLFSIWTVDTIDEGIEILTGVKAGNIGSNRLYEKDSVFHLVQKKVNQFSEKLKISLYNGAESRNELVDV